MIADSFVSQIRGSVEDSDDSVRLGRLLHRPDAVLAHD